MEASNVILQWVIEVAKTIKAKDEVDETLIKNGYVPMDNIQRVLSAKVSSDVKSTILASLVGSESKQNDDLIVKQLGLRPRDTSKVN